MSIPVGPLLLACSCLAVLLLPGATARAAERDGTLVGASLHLEDLCARQVTVSSDPSLTGRVAFAAQAENPGEIARLRQTEGTVAWIGAHAVPCWRPDASGSFAPTLTLQIRVPAGMALAVREGGSGDYRVGAVGGALDVALSGSADLDDRSAGTVAAALSGSGDLHLAEIRGATQLALTGSGSVAIDRATIGSLSATLSGSGTLRIDGGRIGRMGLETSGSGDVSIGAAVTDATIALSGSGSARLAGVSGQLTQATSGSGTVTVAGRVLSSERSDEE